MTRGFTVRLMHVVARVVVADSVPTEVTAEVIDAWRELRIADDIPHDLLVALVPDMDTDRAESDVSITVEPEESLGERLASLLTLAALERMSGHGVMLHAGAIALDDGAVIGFVGPSGRGKTTAMTVLAQTHRYVTDETLVIGDDRSVTPYPKPLLIGRRPEVKEAHPASSLGLRRLDETPLRLARLVLLDRRETAGPPVVTDVPMVDAIVELARESSYLSALHEPLHALATLILTTRGARRLTYSEATTLPDAVHELMLDAGGPVPHVQSVAPLSVSATAPSGWVRAPYTDALLVDDRLVVMREQTITVLDGIAPALWQAATGVSMSELTQAVLREHPAPPELDDPDAVVASAADELSRAGLLHQR